MPRRARTLAAALVAAVLLAAAPPAGAAEEPPPGMAAYVVAFLKKAPEAKEGSAEDATLMAAHLANLRALVVSGDAVAVGPFADDGDVRGLVVFRDMPVERARELLASDPFVRAGRLVVEAHPWWGPAGVGAGYAARAKETPLEKLPFATYQFGVLRKGGAWKPGDTPELRKLQEEHMAHIREMGASGKLVAAGPFVDGGDLRGVFLFAATPDEAKALAAADPMVKVDRLALDLHPWMTTEGVIPEPVRNK